MASIHGVCDVDVAMLLCAALDRLAEEGSVAECRYGARQSGAVRDWHDPEAALAAHLPRATNA